MPQDKQTIIDDIRAYLGKDRGDYKLWYVGLSTDARYSLFAEHRVKEKGDLWIYRTAVSPEEAWEIEKYFLITLGVDGDLGSAVIASTMVYAYKKAMHTKP